MLDRGEQLVGRALGVLHPRSGLAGADVSRRLGGVAGATCASSLRLPGAPRGLGRLGERLRARRPPPARVAAPGSRTPRRRRGRPRQRRRAPRRSSRRENACRGLVPAGLREDRREHRDAEDAAELADRVVGARRLPLLLAAARPRARRSRPGRRRAPSRRRRRRTARSAASTARRASRRAAIQASAIAWRVRPSPMIRFGLIRSESAPATGAMNIGASVQGRIRSPEPSGE